MTSLPSWECGLKCLCNLVNNPAVVCHSLRGSVDWNYNSSATQNLGGVCHSLRGSVDWNLLKPQDYEQLASSHSLRGSVDWNMALVASMVVEDVSLPSWECGLKLLTYGMAHTRIMVTPFVGVWIEIFLQRCMILLRYRHSLRGSVDWNLLIASRMSNRPGHSLRGSVDWNICCTRV